MSRRVWNVLPFSSELDLLEARLTELYDHVHRFVLAEAPLTYSGREKPLYYAENKDRFAPWEDKIIHVVADTSEATSSPEREWRQRQALWQGLGGYEPDDILITTDADEIPHPSELQVTGVKIMNRHHPLAVNLVDGTPWGGYVAHTGARRPDMMELRQRLHSRLIKTVAGHGWHFSWLGGPEAMRAKVQTLLEYEMVPRIFYSAEAYYYGRLNPGSGDKHLAQVEIDGTWPRFMQERKGSPWWYWPGPEAEDAAGPDLRPGPGHDQRHAEKRLRGPAGQEQRHPRVPAVPAWRGGVPGQAGHRGNRHQAGEFHSRVPRRRAPVRRACVVGGLV